MKGKGSFIGGKISWIIKKKKYALSTSVSSKRTPARNTIFFDLIYFIIC